VERERGIDASAFIISAMHSIGGLGLKTYIDRSMPKVMVDLQRETQR
jgi:hypothetical protein